MVGDPHCRICYERQDALDVTAKALAEHTARALKVLKDELARIETDGAA